MVPAFSRQTLARAKDRIGGAGKRSFDNPIFDMSEPISTSTPDLAMLSRRPPPDAGGSSPRRRWHGLLPAAIVAGFALIFLLLFGDRLWPSVEVRVIPVLAVEQAVGDTAAATPVASDPSDMPMLFQASGWIEPDPLPTKATVLIDGVIDEVHVLEGQLVKKGEVIATLINEDAGFSLEQARQGLLAMGHEKAAHCAGIPVTERQIEAAKSRADADKALLGRAEDQLKRLESVGTGAVSTTDLIEARFAVDRLRALADEAASRVGELEGELNKINLEVPMMEARIRLAESKQEEAQLAMDRTRIPSPINGRVLRLLVAPGQKRMLRMDDPDSATVAILYQPESLQVRVDVPLADAAGLSVGQKARIRCNLLPDRVFDGEVTRIVGEADIQRNTLQAKVRLDDPSPQLRPDMLCRVEFLATPGGAPGLAAGGGRGGALKLFVPENALTDGDSAVWVCDPETKRVKKQTVTAGSLRREGRRHVTDGLRPGEWVVIDPSDLAEGQRVKPNLLESL